MLGDTYIYIPIGRANPKTSWYHPEYVNKNKESPNGLHIEYHKFVTHIHTYGQSAISDAKNKTFDVLKETEYEAFQSDSLLPRM